MRVWDRRKHWRGWHENNITKEMQAIITFAATLECRDRVVKYIKARDYRMWTIAFVVGVISGAIGMMLGTR